MEIDSIADGQGTKSAEKRFFIKVFLPKTGPAEVRSCEVGGAKWHNRTSFTNARELEDVFSLKLVEALRHLLGKVTPAARVLTLPDCTIELCGLVLGGIHIMSTFAADGSAVIAMRFQHLIGNVYKAFAPAFGVSDHLAETRDDLSLGVLADLTMPLLDLCAFSEVDGAPDGAWPHPLFRSLALHADEIRFQVELIRRYVDGVDRMPVSAMGPSPVTAPQLGYACD